MSKNYIKQAKVMVISIIFIISMFSVASRIQAGNSSFTIVTTFTILEDFARNISGIDGDVRVISPIGAEVHEWELTPRNFVDLEEADIVFYNGLNIEQWMNQVRAVVRAHVPIIPVGQLCKYPTLPIITGDYAGECDPHIWMDLRGASSYVRTMRDMLIKYNPEYSEIYEENTGKYLEKLDDLHHELVDMISEISKEKRTLITSEAAFIYFANAYGFSHDGIWGTNTEEEGTPRQMMRIIEVIKDRKPAGIFWESTGSNRYALSVSDDTNIPVFGPLYVDSVGKASSGAETYIDMMKHNVNLMITTLK